MPQAATSNKSPMMGPVKEQDIITRVSAIKKIPIKFFVPALLSARLAHEEGNSILKAPKKEIPKTRNSAKNIRLAIQLVARLFKAAGPNMSVIKNPNNVKITMI